MRQFAPRPFPDLPHIPVLFHRAIQLIRILCVAAIEAHHCGSADDEPAGTEDDEENDEDWGYVEAHVVSFVEVHGYGGVTASPWDTVEGRVR